LESKAVFAEFSVLHFSPLSAKNTAQQACAYLRLSKSSLTLNITILFTKSNGIGFFKGNLIVPLDNS
jgi:hypothetical protein